MGNITDITPIVDEAWETGFKWGALLGFVLGAFLGASCGIIAIWAIINLLGEGLT